MAVFVASFTKLKNLIQALATGVPYRINGPYIMNNLVDARGEFS